MNWTIPLENPPRIIEAGLAIHGEKRAGEAQNSIEHFEHRDGVWAIHLHAYRADLKMCGQNFEIFPGFFSVVAPKTNMEFAFRGRSSHFYVLFRFDEARGEIRVPAMQDLSARSSEIARQMEAILTATSQNGAKATALLWALLWDVCAEPDTPSEPPALRKARTLIEMRLGENLSVEQLAHEVGWSHNHLTRQFRAHLGLTPSAYIAQRRVERARQLLLHTTRPVKSIAAEVGMSDLHALGKSLKRQYGSSPRALRRATLTGQSVKRSID